MKTCTCRACGHDFDTFKVQPFCSGVCRVQYRDTYSRTYRPMSNLEGATDDRNNQGHGH